MDPRENDNDPRKPLAGLIAASGLPPETAARLRAFITAFYGQAAPTDLIGRRPEDLYGAVLSHWELMDRREPGEPKVRVYSPAQAEHHWQSPHTVVEVVADDMPFLVDSLRMALNRHGLTVHLVIHTVLRVRRDPQGRIAGLPAGDGAPEAVIYVEVDRRTQPELLAELREDLLEALGDVRAAVSDWPAMRAQVRAIVAELEARPPPGIEPAALAEAGAFLQWIEDHHFTFLGYRRYDLVQEDGEDVLRIVPGSELGTAPRAQARTASQAFLSLPAALRAEFREPYPLLLTKANVRSTVHRPVYLDYVGVKRYDAAGSVIGEHRFLGLYTSAAYNHNPRDIPLLRRKVQAVLDRAGLPPYSHDGKALLNILETYPRDELLQITEQELFDNAIAILRLQERHQVRLFVRREAFGRFVSCIVYIPRERFNTEASECIRGILIQAFNGENADFNVYLSESVLARLYFIIRTSPGGAFEYDRAALEARIAACTRTWADELGQALLQAYGEEAGQLLYARYRHAFPAAYRDDFPAAAALRDIEDIEELIGPDRQVLALYRPRGAPPGRFRFKLFSGGQAVALSDILPMLENMGVKVIRERPYEIRPAGREGLWIYDFSLTHGEEAELPAEAVKDIFQEAFARVWRGEAENDGFNRLVLRARLTWREVMVLRAYAKYLRQTGASFSQAYMEQVLADNAAIAGWLAALFHARLDPGAQGHGAIHRSRLAADIQEALEGVSSLDHDRILRRFLALVQATVRTNYYQLDGQGRPKPYLALKLDPELIPELPLPRPRFEIFVYSPRVEAVHLRGGPVARGGIRWSDRREDFRTEVLGLMKAQMVKNAIIVPVGAKGGFVVKRPPATADRAVLMDEVVACYQTFMRGLLDLTDNIVEGRVVPPPALVRHDDDDPYLVVAADKGTAGFSDIANAVAGEYGYWLGDAYASGGSSGYDHKGMGITARGGWESVKRHFRELGVDIQTSDFTVVGIGDMSGDVFGNGMLQSRHIKLIGAFDHRHIFIDPDPDPAASYAERERLFRLPRSSWADYDARLISRGGGVYPRTAKAIRLSAEAGAALGVHAAAALTPDELIRLLLRAPVDLLWNGGIGTYVKASTETNAEVGDRANDAVRVNGRHLRCRVVGEGGNLGCTQRARVEYALAGGRINTDFIDNAGGVACSDYEVNIKILLNAVATAGALSRAQRELLLAGMADEVAELVLQESYWQTWAISLMERGAPALADEHMRYIRHLEREGRLDRALEYLPDDETMVQRQGRNQGLTRPELAVLTAYAKIDLDRQLLASDAPEDAFLARKLVRYFPTPLRERFRDAAQGHRLRRELIATFVVNRLVNRLGATFVFRLQEELGSPAAQIVRAYLAVWEIFALRGLAGAVAGLDNRAPAALQAETLLQGMRLVEHGTLRLLGAQAGATDIAATVRRYQPGVRAVAEHLPALLPPAQAQALAQALETLTAAGVPAALASQVARLPALYAALDIVDIAAETRLAVEPAARFYFALEAELDLGWLRGRIAALPANDRWKARARAALDDDLYGQQRALAAAILRGSGEAGPEARLQVWTGRARGAVERYRRIVADLKAAAAVDLAMLNVAVRELRGLVALAAAGPEPQTAPAGAARSAP